MSEILGSKDRPYTFDDYQSRVQQANWYGGWVLDMCDKLVYITANLSIEQDNENGVLGRIDNPFSVTAYGEMMSAMTWPGGYVQHGGGLETIEYHRSYEEQNSASGCGCGCGCGSGAGCGCGGGYLRAGNDTIHPVGMNSLFDIVVEWGEGSFSGSNLPSVSAALVLAPSQQTLPLSASWDGNYRVRITGSIKAIGANSGSTAGIWNISEYYNIPGSYYN
jgi:hypothetical protein